MSALRKLPTVEHEGQTYFIDFRLEELRPIEQPFKSFPFVFLCDEQLKAKIRGQRAVSWQVYHMAGIDS
jgi:hypothetical protein